MRLVHRITLAILAAMTVVVVIVAVSMYVSVQRGFGRYIRAVEVSRLAPAARRIADEYARTGSWAALARDPARFGELLRAEPAPVAPRDGEDRPREDRPREDRPPEDRPREDRPREDRPPDDRPPDDRPREDRPREDRPPDDRPRDDRPRGDRPPDDRPPAPRGPAGRPAVRDTDPLDVPRRVSLYDADGRRLIGDGRLADASSRAPLIVDGVTVGWLGIHGVPHVDDELDAEYLRQLRGHLLAIVAVALAAGLLTGWLLTRWIVRPVTALSAGTRRLAAGDHDVRLGPGSDDELGQVMRDFDRLAATLGADAQARQQWVADTSHELRTPITVLRAEIEALQDGIRPLDAAALASLHAEIGRLGKLVDDLDELARSDRGTLVVARVPLAPDPVIAAVVEGFRARFRDRRLAVELTLTAPDARILGDGDRLRQIMTNLLENSARYTDPGGQVQIHSCRDGASWCLRCDDTAPGVPPAALGRLFERLFRADGSRSRAHGGAGLGLAISQRLVEAHGGTITAAPSPLGGLRIELRLPLLAAEAAA